MTNYIKDDGGRSQYFDHESHYGDCVIRACAIATDRDYLDVFKDLCQIGIKIGDLPNAPSVYDEFLTCHGFTKNKAPKRNGKKIPIRTARQHRRNHEVAPRGNRRQRAARYMARRALRQQLVSQVTNSATPRGFAKALMMCQNAGD